MNKKNFAELLQSLKEAGKIMRGEMKPYIAELGAGTATSDGSGEDAFAHCCPQARNLYGNAS